MAAEPRTKVELAREEFARLPLIKPNKTGNFEIRFLQPASDLPQIWSHRGL